MLRFNVSFSKREVSNLPFAFLQEITLRSGLALSVFAIFINHGRIFKRTKTKFFKAIDR